MSDYPNGRPPGQNNIDATSPAYVPVENDPTAMAQKPDSDRPKEDGIEVREEAGKEVQAELEQASRNIVEPSTAEPEQEPDEPKKDDKAPPPRQQAANTNRRNPDDK